MARTRANIEIEDDHVDVITDRYGVPTKTEAVDSALGPAGGLAVHVSRRWPCAVRSARCAVRERRGTCRQKPGRVRPLMRFDHVKSDAIAFRYSPTLLSRDADLDRVAGVIGLEMDQASRRA